MVIRRTVDQRPLSPAEPSHSGAFSHAEADLAALPGQPALPNRLHGITVVIPAWQPPERVVVLVRRLLYAGFGRVVVVDDGSPVSCAPVFATLAALPRVEVLHHPENLGKGRALKTAFRRLLEADEPPLGVVTADADGQHTPADIQRVAEAFLDAAARPAVLGVRSFSGQVPLRSRAGNQCTGWLFRRFTGVAVTDTQTGLRVLPVEVLPRCLGVPGDRYEYEMAMLADLCAGPQAPLQVPIETVYLDGNRSSHFRPVWDSLRVCAQLVRCCLMPALGRGVHALGERMSGMGRSSRPLRGDEKAV